MKCQLIQDGIILKREEIDSQEQGLFIPAKAKSQPFYVKIKLTNGLELSFDKVPDSEWMGKLLSSIGGNDVINQEL